MRELGHCSGKEEKPGCRANAAALSSFHTASITHDEMTRSVRKGERELEDVGELGHASIPLKSGRAEGAGQHDSIIQAGLFSFLLTFTRLLENFLCSRRRRSSLRFDPQVLGRSDPSSFSLSPASHPSTRATVAF
jgi:hypothetical protein